MPRRHRSAGRRSRRPLARLAAPVAIPVALVVAVGAIVAIVDHSGANNITDAANANCASPAAYVSAGQHSRPRPPRVRQHGVAHGGRLKHGLRDDRRLRDRVPDDGRLKHGHPDDGRLKHGHPDDGGHQRRRRPRRTAPTRHRSARRRPVPEPRRRRPAPPRRRRPTSTATSSSRRTRCRRKGLATPYQLTGPDGMTPAQSGCTMANAANLGAFVQATILNPRTGQLYVYDPLVITQGTTPAVAPTVPDPAAERGGHDRLRVQRHGPHPGRRHGERPSAGQLRQRPGGLGLRPGVVLQRDQLLQRRVPARARGQAEGAVGGHLQQDRRLWRQARHRPGPARPSATSTWSTRTSRTT